MLKVQGELIRLHRKTAFTSRQAFLAAAEEQGISISEMTLRRAEGGEASDDSLRKIAQVLGRPPSLYHFSLAPIEIRSRFELAGTWTALYYETDTDPVPYLVWERLTVQQEGGALSGVYELIKSNHPDRAGRSFAFDMRGKLTDDVITGTYFVSGREGAMGLGVFQLKVIREGRWAEGFCTYASDDDLIAASRNIWVKSGVRDGAALLHRAEQMMAGSPSFHTAP